MHIVLARNLAEDLRILNFGVFGQELDFRHDLCSLGSIIGKRQEDAASCLRVYRQDRNHTYALCMDHTGTHVYRVICQCTVDLLSISIIFSSNAA